MQRDSEKTRQKILAGLERIITREGFTGVGVNAVAREAGVDKVLIYRYFGSMGGLLQSFADEREICPRMADVLDDLPEGTPLHEIATRMIVQHITSFYDSPLAQELVCWELTEQNPLTVSFGKEMEKRELSALAEKGAVLDDEIVTLVTMLLCGLEYLVLRGRNNNPMMSLDYSTPGTRDRVEQVVSSVMKAFFGSRKAREGKQ
jgi:AcrR family transcriptional regulator